MVKHDLKNEPIGFLPFVVEETHLAEILGVSPRVMRNLRTSGRGPAYVEVGRNRIYLRDAVLNWLEHGNTEVGDE